MLARVGTVVLTAATLTGLLLLADIAVEPASRIEAQPASSSVGATYAALVLIPKPLRPQDVLASIWRVQINAWVDGVGVADFWHKLPNTRMLHATVQASDFGAQGWVFLFVGPRAWVLVLRDAFAPYAAMDSGVKPFGPKPVKWLETASGPVCHAVAARFLMSAQYDSGALQPGPSDAGTWPTSSLIACADGSRWELRTRLNGLQLAPLAWTTEPPGEAVNEGPSIPALPPLQVGWQAPDAAMWKSCYPVPITTACP